MLTPYYVSNTSCYPRLSMWGTLGEKAIYYELRSVDIRPATWNYCARIEFILCEIIENGQ